MPEKKPLFRGDPDLLAGSRRYLGSQPAMLAEPTRVMQRVFKTEGVIDGPRKLERFVVKLDRLVGKTEVLQG